MIKKNRYAPPCFSASSYRQNTVNPSVLKENNTVKTVDLSIKNYTPSEIQNQNKSIQAMEKNICEIDNNISVCTLIVILLLFFCVQNQGA